MRRSLKAVCLLAVSFWRVLYVAVLVLWVSVAVFEIALGVRDVLVGDVKVSRALTAIEFHLARCDLKPPLVPALTTPYSFLASVAMGL